LDPGRRPYTDSLRTVDGMGQARITLLDQAKPSAWAETRTPLVAIDGLVPVTEDAAMLYETELSASYPRG